MGGDKRVIISNDNPRTRENKAVKRLTVQHNTTNGQLPPEHHEQWKRIPMITEQTKQRLVYVTNESPAQLPIKTPLLLSRRQNTRVRNKCVKNNYWVINELMYSFVTRWLCAPLSFTMTHNSLPLFVQLYNYTITGSKSYCGFFGSPNADVHICPPQGVKCPREDWYIIKKLVDKHF